MAKEAETKRGPGRPPGSKNKNTSGSSGKSSGSSGSGKSSGSSGSGKSSGSGSKGSKNVNAVRASSRDPEDVKAAVRQEKIEQMQMQYDRDRRNVDVIWSITLFAIALFLFFTVVMDSTGSFGMRVHDICLGLFGHIAYALPFIVAIFAGLLLARKLQHFSGRTLTFSLLIILNMCMLNSYRYIDDKNIGIGFADVANYYVDGVKLDSGGAFGMWFGNLMVKFFGKPGLLIIAIAVLLICIFLVANSPISRFFDNLAKKHESRRLMREMDDAEMAKVQMAVARTATPGADPVTGVVPKGARPVDMQYTIVEPAGGTPAEDPAEKSLWRSILNGISKEEEPSAVPPKRGSFLSGGSDNGKTNEVSAAEAREYAAVRSGKNDSIVYTEPPAARPKNSAASMLRALAADPDDDIPELPPQKDDSVMQLFSRDTIFGRIKKKLSGTDPDIQMPKETEPAEDAAPGRFPEMSFDDVDELDLGYPGRRIDRTVNSQASQNTARGLDSAAVSSGTTGLGGNDSVQVNKSYGLSDDEGHSGTYGLDGHAGGQSAVRGLGEMSWAGGNAASAGLGLRPSGSTAAQRTNSRSGRPAAARQNSGGMSGNSGRASAGSSQSGTGSGTSSGGRNAGSSAGPVNGRTASAAAAGAVNGLAADPDEQDNNGRSGKTYRRSGKTEDLSQMTAEEAALADSFGAGEEDAAYTLPPVNLLKKSTASRQLASNVQLEEKANLLEKTLNDFGVDARVLTVTQGASVTRYEVQPATGVKVSKITSLADDIALNLRAKSIRIEAPIPGKAAVGIEVENDKPAPVLIRELIESEEFQEAGSKLTFVVGKDISGNNIVADLKSMPHLLIAGATGSGKSVCINTIITSFLYKAKPSELKLIMIDPKVVELANYNGIPHLLTPVVTDARKASRALAIAVEEMDKRYELFAQAGVKDLESYNELMRAEHEYAMCKPQVVIIIDELADLMMVASSEVESSICRLAQKARAAGMHLIVATQRPSVDVVTGLIKANIPSRIAFSVASQIDSRTILDMTGAEKLLGKGDMLFSPVGSNKPYRVQGPFISDGETEKVIRFVKKEGGDAVYDEEIGNAIESTDKRGGSEPQDELTEDAIAYILKSRQASVSMLQRRFRIGYNRAARIIDEIEEKGIIGPSDGSRPRQVLLTEDEYYSGGANAQAAQETIDEISPQEKAELEAAVTGKPHMNLVRPAEAAEVFDDPEPEEEDFEEDIDDADVRSEESAAIDYFNSLPESIRRQILSSDHNYND